MSGLTKLKCLTCEADFASAEIHRQHYKTDWHRYNLKRKVIDLDPVSCNEFFQKLNYLPNVIEPDPEGKYCLDCHKQFSNKRTFNNHLGSRKHKQAARGSVEDEEYLSIINDISSNTKEVVKNGGVAISITDCLFCDNHCKTVDNNLIHMSTVHSFCLPDAEYIVDLEALLVYLGAKVGEGYMCLWCNESGRSFHSLDAVRKHMIDKGHCKIRWHTDNDAVNYEFSDFYDYSQSYPADEVESEDDSDVDFNYIDDSGFQLVLPSGVTIGHRSLMRYYRQNIVSTKNTCISVAGRKRIIDQYKALGWSQGLTPSEAKKKDKNIRYMQKIKQKYWLKLGMQGNNQKYWRDPTL